MQKHDSEMLMKLLSTAEGKRLLSMMQSGNRETISKAAAAARSGNYSQVQELLGPLINGTEAQKLAERLDSRFG